MTDGQLRNGVDPAKFNSSAEFPYSLRLLDFQAAMHDVYDLFKSRLKRDLKAIAAIDSST